MKIIFIILQVPLVSVTFSAFFSDKCDQWPPHATTSTSECAYNEDGPMSDFVNFYFIKRGYNDYQKLQEYEMTQRINQSLPTYIVLHGWEAEVGDSTNGWLKAVGIKILEYIDANIILVDYGSVSNCNYLFLATDLIFEISKYIAVCVTEKWNLSPDQIKVIGHSLGGHIAGLTGSYLNGQIDEITALDPAGPGFDGQIFGMRQSTLNSSCAQFVQVIHTKPIFLGTYKHLGDSDFFANIFLPQQPGCALLNISCSHSRAYELYFASMFPENKFIGKVSPLSRNQDKSSRFGFFNDRKNGSFYFETTSCFGYAK